MARSDRVLAALTYLGAMADDHRARMRDGDVDGLLERSLALAVATLREVATAGYQTGTRVLHLSGGRLREAARHNACPFCSGSGSVPTSEISINATEK